MQGKSFVDCEIEWAAFRDIASLKAEFPLFRHEK